MMTFSKAFSTHPLEVANLDKFKVSFKQVDESIAMVCSLILLSHHFSFIHACHCTDPYWDLRAAGFHSFESPKPTLFCFLFL